MCVKSPKTRLMGFGDGDSKSDISSRSGQLSQV